MEYLQTGALRSTDEVVAAFGSYDGPRRPPVGGPRPLGHGLT
jgi:hypothetical protein